jgi:3-hydroxyisobutyrate dehydrogenase
MATKIPVAVMGLGLMGSGMASRLVGHGFNVTVFNRSAQKAEALGALGAKVAKTPGEAAQGADFVISMLADDGAAREVWLGAEGAMKNVNRDAVLIECSTVSVQWVKELSAAAGKRGCELLDAPVTGSKSHAAAGELLFLVGGSDRALAKARPVLAAMSRDIFHLGPTGSGALVKLINNFVCGVQVVAIAEALALMERTDLDVAKALAVLTEGAPGSPLVKALSKRMTSRDYTPNFMLKLMKKDLQYAIEEAGRHSMSLATAAAALGTMSKAEEAGNGDKDFSSVVELLRKKNK